MKKAVWAGIVGSAVAARNAAAVSLGEMAKSAEDDLGVITGFLEIAFYLLGLLVVAFGFFRVKKHMDQPQQVSLAGAIVAILIGAAIILIPVVLDGIAQTFGVSGGTGIARPKL